MDAPADDNWTGRYLTELRTQRKLSSHTIEAYARDLGELGHLAGHTDWATLTHFDIRRFAAKLHAGGQSASSIARKLSGWRGFFNWLARHTALAANPVDGIRAPRRAKRLPKALPVDDAMRLLDANRRGHPEPAELCDRAMFELLYSSGLRVSELAGLDVGFVPARDGAPASLGWLELEAQEVVVTGKGNKMRRVPVGAPAPDAIAAWGGGGGGGGGRGGGRARRRAPRPPPPPRRQQCFIPVGARRPRQPARGAAPPQDARPEGRLAGPRPSPRAAPLVCLAPAAVLGRPARGPGTAGPRQHHLDPDLYLARLPAPGGRL
jgi:hypothetical protein